ncbi:hypothetical protein BH23PLA1_BH23PLA1_16340 [soil metagenome]
MERLSGSWWGLALGFVIVLPGGSSLAAASVPDDPVGEAPSTVEAQDREEIAIWEARLRAAEAQLRGAEALKELEQTNRTEVQRQRGIGAVSPRSKQMAEVDFALAEAWCEFHRAHREEARIRLQQARRRVENPGAEDDPEVRRDRLREEVDLRRAHLKALEAQAHAAELLLESEQASLENYRQFVLSGRSPPIEGEQARYRVARAESWRGTFQALRDEAQVRLDRAERLQKSDDERLAADPLDPTPNDRLQELEQEIEALRTESLINRRLIDMMMNRPQSR